jgi:hypothetical protein
LLLTQHGANSNAQVDRIRMATLETSHLSNYMDPGEWSYFICSDYALRKLGERVTLGYYKDLCRKAHTMNDFGLFGIAFENCFHAMAREKTNIKLMVREYDRTKAQAHEHVYSEKAFQSGKHLLKGKEQAEFDNVMKTWSSGVDYWYPESRSLKTIDSIARSDNEFWLLQMTTSKSHSIDQDYLNKISNFLPGPSTVAYIAVVPNKAICDKFRLDPTNPAEINIPLCVAYINDDFFNDCSRTME